MFGSRAPGPQRPTISSFKFDKSGWEITRSETGEVFRTNEFGDVMVQRFRIAKPGGLPPNWRDVRALRAHLLASPSPKMAVISIDVLTLAGGISAASGKVPPPPRPDVVPVIETQEQLDALYAEARNQPPQVTACDDEQWDAAFPQHPLSRVRGYLRKVRETMTVDAAVRAARPFAG